eukprot:TRINITY_DN15250_c0_g1_i1.p1 TRINITY_DN15250_c0_g1~~TRINITY_DN15250_c0_g1_i1.p1  ORF type:complete len:126 (+),score=31.29 TRINITY_DN15250_c0_g1_i1:91-468(+)
MNHINNEHRNVFSRLLTEFSIEKKVPLSFNLEKTQLLCYDYDYFDKFGEKLQYLFCILKYLREIGRNLEANTSKSSYQLIKKFFKCIDDFEKVGYKTFYHFLLSIDEITATDEKYEFSFFYGLLL